MTALETTMPDGVRRYRPDDREALAAFQERMFTPDVQRHHLGFRPQPSGYRDWQFRNPAAAEPNLWLAWRQGRVVGQQAGIPVALKVGERLVDASWGADLLVDPQYRMRGVGPALSKVHAAAHEAVLGCGVSEVAHRAYVRAGWLDLGRIPWWVRPLDLGRLAAAGAKSARFGRLARFAGYGAPAFRVADAAFRGCVHGALRLRHGRRAAFAAVSAFDARVDRLWADVGARLGVAVRRDLAYLAWRFDDPFNRDCYRRYYLTEAGELCGYAVLRTEHVYGVPVGMIVDYLVRPDRFMLLFMHCLEALRRSGAAAASLLTLHAGAAARLAGLGFVRAGNGPRFVASPAADDPELRAALADRRHWFLTSADSDVDNPMAGPMHLPGEAPVPAASAPPVPASNLAGAGG